MPEQTVNPSPTPPYFSYNAEHHGIELSELLETTLEVPLRNVLAGADAAWITYDACGFAWRFRYGQPPGGISGVRRLLARNRFIPFLFLQKIPITWTEQRPYHISELREAYLRGIDHDEYWFTRFVDARELERSVRSCQSFEELLAVWRSMKTETPEDPAKA